jgi:hypothetical protein
VLSSYVNYNFVHDFTLCKFLCRVFVVCTFRMSNIGLPLFKLLSRALHKCINAAHCPIFSGSAALPGWERLESHTARPISFAFSDLPNCIVSHRRRLCHDNRMFQAMHWNNRKTDNCNIQTPSNIRCLLCKWYVTYLISGLPLIWSATVNPLVR